MTVTVLAVLGLVASRFGLSAIPAYLLAGLVLGPNQPEVFSYIEPSEVTEFVAELGIIFLLFFPLAVLFNCFFVPFFVFGFLFFDELLLGGANLRRSRRRRGWGFTRGGGFR